MTETNTLSGLLLVNQTLANWPLIVPLLANWILLRFAFLCLVNTNSLCKSSVAKTIKVLNYKMWDYPFEFLFDKESSLSVTDIDPDSSGSGYTHPALCASTMYCQMLLILSIIANNH